MSVSLCVTGYPLLRGPRKRTDATGAVLAATTYVTVGEYPCDITPRRCTMSANFLLRVAIHRRSFYPTAKLRPRGRSRTRWRSRSHADVGGATAARVRACRSPAVGLADGCVRHNDSHLRKTPDAARSSLCDGFGRDSASSCRPSGHRARFRGRLFLSGGAAAVHGLRVLHRVPRPPPHPDLRD